MKTGVLILGEHPPSRLVALCRLAEERGYDIFWYADERFFRDVYSGLALCAAQTSRIRLGPCVTDPYSRHPALTAMAIATLDEISGGRAVLGIGAGVSGFAELGITPARPAVAVREAVHLIRHLLAGETVTVEGETVRFRDGRLHFRPVKAAVPIYVASNARRGQEVAGQVGDGAIMQGCVADSALEGFFSHLRTGAARAGRRVEEIDVVARINTCIHRDARIARDLMKPTIARSLIAQQPKFQTFAAAGLHVPDPLREMVKGRGYTYDASLLQRIAQYVPDDFVEALTFAGTAGDVTAQAARLVRRGVTQITIYPMSPEGDIEGQLVAFADRVVPAVRREVRA